MIYFKAFRGYSDDFISVRENELERMFYAQLSGEMFVGSGGSVEGAVVMVRQSALMIAADFFKQKDAPVGLALSEYGPQIAAMLSRYVRPRVKVGI